MFFEFEPSPYSAMDQMVLKHEHHVGSAADEGYGHGQWVGIADYQSPPLHQSPMHEYHGFNFMSTAHMPMEPSDNRPMSHSYPTHQQLQPLIMPQPQWPSMLTNSSTSAPPTTSHYPPLAPVTSISGARSVPPVIHPPAPTTQRRTLTDQDRRRMCQYHEDNPTVKQTEIGAMFGVERSTVSKVLRQKDKYLCVDDGSRSPVKRSKGKFPDIERALSNWARNHQRQGLPFSDAIIRDKARFFAATVGTSECHDKVNSTSWLEKFKQKNHLLGAKPRKPSENSSDGRRSSESKSGSHTPNGLSPVSPQEPAPISPKQTQEYPKTGSPDGYANLAYRHTHSQSTTSLASCLSDNTAPSSFTSDMRSPTSPFFSPNLSCGPSPFISQQARLSPVAANSIRPRSQTFPMVGIEPSYISPTPSTEPLTSKYLQRSMAMSSMETPLSELPEPDLSIEHSLHHHQPPHGLPNYTTSPSSMAPPPMPTLSTGPSPMTSPTIPPSQDEARQALEILMTFFEHQPTGAVDPQEYFTMGKLMEKLKLQGGLPGGMQAIPTPERDVAPVAKKRSINSL